MSNNFKLIDVSNAVFPDTARESFLQYAQSCKVNPYINMLEARLDAAAHMAGVLKAVKHKKSDAIAILNYFDGIREGNGDLPAFLIHNFPSDPKDKLLATPSKLEFGSSFNQIGKEGYVAEISMLAANTLSGEVPVITPETHGGYPFHHLSPREGAENIPSGIGTKKLPWHTAQDWKANNGMHLTLLCIKNINTPTFAASATDVYSHLVEGLTLTELDILEENRFIFISAPSPDDEIQKSSVKPILIKRNGHVVEMNINCNPDKMMAADPNDKEAQRIVDKVIVAVSELHQGVMLKPNDFLSVDNLQNIHTRGPYHEDDLRKGQERQLIRTHAQRDGALLHEIADIGL